MKTPFLSNKGVVLEMKDYNENYFFIRYAAWTYKGELEESKNFYLHPKHLEIKPLEIKISDSIKYNNKPYISCITNTRFYIPENFIKFIDVQ